jgi:hypothetical protein
MKRSTITTITVIALLYVSILPSIAYMVNGETDKPVVDTERSVKIINGGIIFMNDTFTLTAPEGSELTVKDFWIGYPDYFTSERSTFEVLESGAWQQIEASGQALQSIQGSRLEFTVPITLSAGSSLTLRASYLSLENVGGTSLVYTAVLPVFPVIEYNISQYQLEVELPPDAVFDSVSSSVNMTDTEVGDHWIVSYQGENIAANAVANASFSYTHSTDDELLLTVESASRSVTVKSNKLLIEDSYALTNWGPPFFRFLLGLPSDSGSIKARDGVGSIEVTATESDGPKEVVVFPRAAIIPGNRWVFTVSYTTEIGEHLTSTGGASHISYPNIELPHFIRDLEATVSRPESEIVRLTYGATLQSERPAIEAEVPPGSIVPALRPIAIIAAIVVIVVAVVFLRRREKTVAVEVAPKAGVPTLNEFIEKQRERVGLLKALESLDEDLQEGKIDRNQFERMTAEHSRGLSNLSDSLKQLGKDLTEKLEFAEPLREIRQAEGELTRITSDLKNLEVRLRARRVSRSDFERRRTDRIRRRGLAIKRIEKALESLGS